MTATRLPVSLMGGAGVIQPISQPFSTIAASMFLIVTAEPLRARTHDDSQGAGQVLPVNSGKLFVSCSARSASSQRLRCTSSFQSGIRFPSGQPVWQNGIPQSMHRDAWARTLSDGIG